MRHLTGLEQKRLKTLTENSVSLTLIEPTETGLKKSIMDATGPVRNYLKEYKLHDYELQGQGQEHKVLIAAVIHEASEAVGAIASLYRPETKKGDPRIWFSKLGNHADPNDILALICYEKRIHVLNLTKLPLLDIIGPGKINPVNELIQEINRNENAVAIELLSLLRRIV